MQVISSIDAIKNQVVKLKKEGKKIGFVPTMGALHAGHISLINRAKKDCDVVICSIFVNPTQFNDPKDFEKYPQTINTDTAKLLKAKCHILFLPTVAEMYPDGTAIKTQYDFGFIATTLEGAFRPGHFDGMAQIVGLLLQAVSPHRLYMGQKDYQQAMICGALIKLLKLKIELIVCPIKREKDGLAMSSRNIRLDPTARAMAVEIVKTLRAIQKMTAKARIEKELSVATIEKKALQRLTAHPHFKVEYIAIRNGKTLQPLKSINAETPIVALIATWLAGVRLIDNRIV